MEAKKAAELEARRAREVELRRVQEEQMRRAEEQREAARWSSQLVSALTSLGVGSRALSAHWPPFPSCQLSNQSRVPGGKRASNLFPMNLFLSVL